MYKMINKCRMCGEQYEEDYKLGDIEEDTLMEIAHRSTEMYQVDEDILDSYKFKPTSAHACSNGNIGLVDVIGFRKV